MISNLLYQFKMWSVWHYVFIASPFVIIAILYFLLKNKSDKVKYIVGVVIGVLSVAVLAMRNIDIAMHSTRLDPETIPLQVCHFGNIMVFISLVFKSKTATSVAWSLNMLAAFSSLVFADSLSHYGDVFCIRAQAYIWGHLLIIVGAAYAVLLKIVRIDFKSFLQGLGVLVLLVIPSIILNPYFNNVHHQGINYFYIYNSNGVPFEFLWNDKYTHTYGKWFQINYVYTFSVIAIFLVIIYGIYLSQKLLYKKDKDYQTHHIFYNFFHKKNNY